MPLNGGHGGHQDDEGEEHEAGLLLEAVRLHDEEAVDGDWGEGGDDKVLASSNVMYLKKIFFYTWASWFLNFSVNLYNKTSL